MKPIHSIITKKLCSAVLQTNCAKPIVRHNRLGNDVVLPCGYCENCLKRQRNILTYKLKTEINDDTTLFSFFNTYTYGDLQVYNEKLHSWETDFFAPSLPVISKDDLKSKTFEYFQNGFYSPLRVNVHDFKKDLEKGNFKGIVYLRDIQLTIKKIRQRFVEKFKKYNLYIKFQLLGHYGLTEGRTHAPHFHVLFFIKCDDVNTQHFLNGQPLLRQYIHDEFVNISLVSWVFCARWYDYHKGQYVGKDCEDVVNGNVSCYVSRYISRSTEKAINPVSSVFPCRKLGSKNMGLSVLKKDNDLFLSAFLATNVDNKPFIVFYNENGYKKAYSQYYKKKWLLHYYDVSSTEYSTFLKYQNDTLRKHYITEFYEEFYYFKFLQEDENGVFYYCIDNKKSVQKNSKYKLTLSKRLQDYITLSTRDSKSVTYNQYGEEVLQVLSIDVQERCEELYNFECLCAQINYNQVRKDSSYISALFDLKDDDYVLGLDVTNNVLKCFNFHKFANDLRLHLQFNKKQCEEILNDSLEREKAHALKNKYNVRVC